MENPDRESIPDPSQLGTKRSPAWWDRWFLNMAKHTSLASKDPSTQVGAVIVDKKQRIISQGFNGLPRGVIDSHERLNNRELKYKMIIHAEINSIIFAGSDLDGCTIYTWPFLACSSCASVIINSGIKRIVTTDYFPDRWKESFDLSKQLFKEAGVVVFTLPKE
jgi:dCMP deaminase